MTTHRTVLVTGAGGFIGSHLVEALVEQGTTVRAFVRYTSRRDSGWLSRLPNDVASSVEIIYGDLRDTHAVEQAVSGVTQVFHLGALIAIPYSYVHPDEVISVNILGTLNVLNAARRHGLELVVHTSTCEVYGTAQYVPIDESHPLQGQSPYSASKIAADKIAESFWRSYDLPVVTVRPFNTYGPRQSMRAVIPTIVTQALTSDRVVLGSIHPTRDFTFVKDTVAGLVRAADVKGVAGGVFNLGTGREIAIGELAKLVIGIVGRSVELVTDTGRIRPKNSEVDRLCSDNTLAANTLGWQPKTLLEDGLAHTVEWVRGNLHEYQFVDRYAI